MTSPSRSPFSALRRNASSSCPWSMYPRSIRSVPRAVRFASLAWSISVSVMLPTPSFRSSRIVSALSAGPRPTLTVGFPAPNRPSPSGIEPPRVGLDRGHARSCSLEAGLIDRGAGLPLVRVVLVAQTEVAERHRERAVLHLPDVAQLVHD